MPKGHFPKFKSAICNFPIGTSDIVHVVPYGADSNGEIEKEVEFSLQKQYIQNMAFKNIHCNVI